MGVPDIENSFLFGCPHNPVPIGTLAKMVFHIWLFFLSGKREL